MKKKLVVLALLLGLGAMSYSAFHMIYEKYPVIGTWRYEDNAAAITFNFEVGEFSGIYENLYWPDGEYDEKFEGTYMVKEDYIHLTMNDEYAPYTIKVEYNMDRDVLTMYSDDPMYAGIAFTRVKG